MTNESNALIAARTPLPPAWECRCTACQIAVSHGAPEEDRDYEALRTRIESLAAELAQAREDARRYRWLRDRLHAIDYEYGEPHVPVLVFEYPQGQAVGPGRALDAAIDAALAEQEGK